MKKFFLPPVCLLAFILSSQAQKFTLFSLPDSIYSGPQGEFHVQGMAVDEVHGFIYFSFTDKLIKMDMSGHLIGSVTGLVGHLGDITFDPKTNEVYASLEFKNDAIGEGISKKLGLQNSNKINFYIAMFNGAKIVRLDMNAQQGDVLRTAYLKEVVDDYKAEVKDGDRVFKHRFGCSGIDGITIGPSFGNLQSHQRYLYVAYGIYGDTSRNDNNHQVILKYDIADLNQSGRILTQNHLHHSGPKKPLAKYFIMTGNTRYGIQNLAFDAYTGDFFVAVYTGTKPQFPNYNLFVINGHKKPVKAEITSNNTAIKVETLSLLPAGLDDPKTGIMGWYFKWGSTGLFPLGKGYFYISHNKKTDNQQATTIYKYKWVGNNKEAFALVK
ncbi:MAG: hypothetical protein ACRDE2_04475 [Chitinophagaceae bacterium]